MASLLADEPLTIFTAVTDPSAEADLVAAFGRLDVGVTVVRRCVDLVDLLAAAATGTGRAALVSADLRGLDRDAVARLFDCGVAVVGLASGEPAERLLLQLGVGLVVPAGSPAEQVAGALRAAGEAPPPVATRPLDRGLGADGPYREAQSRSDGSDPGGGTVVAVWGPIGAPGRTTVALGLADAISAQGTETLLIDADPYGGTVALMTGLLDEAGGLIAACRAANAGLLDVARLASVSRELTSRLRVLTGLDSAKRWPELRPSSLDLVLQLAGRLAEVTVVDCGFCLEDDEELSYDTVAPRRNAATLTALQMADRVVAVASADPLGLARLIRELPALAAVLQEPLTELVARGRLVVVVNRLRPGLLAGDPLQEVQLSLTRLAAVPVFAAVPMDAAAADAAHGRGQLLSEVCPGSGLARAMTALATACFPAESRAAAATKTRRSRGFRRRRAIAGSHR